MQPFASSQDFNDALTIFIGEFSGQSPGAQQIAQAAVNVLSFGTGQLMGVATAPLMLGASAPTGNDAEKLQLLQGIKNDLAQMHATAGASVGGAAFPWSQIPWSTLFNIAWTLLQKYFPWVPTPPAPGLVEPGEIAQALAS